MIKRNTQSLLRLTCASLLAGVLASCGTLSGRPASREADSGLHIPAIWTASDPVDAVATGSTRQWWLRFDDPLLATLITRAQAQNRTLLATHASLDQARALRDVAAAAMWPTLAASGSVQTSRAGNVNGGMASQAALNASFTPDVFGINRFALNASAADLLTSESGLGEAQGALASETALNYILLRGLQVRLAIAQRNLESQLETLQITSWRQQAGLVTTLELEQARASSEQTRAQLPALQISIAQTLHALRVLSGEAPATTDDLQASLLLSGPVPRPLDRLWPSLPAEVLRQRPDVRAAESRVTAAWARSLQAQASRKPGFSIAGSLGLSGITLASLGNGAAVFSSLLAGVTLPVFDGGAAKARVRAQDAVWEQSRMNYQAVVLSALQQVADALVAFQQDERRQISLQKAADAAAIAAGLARQRFSAGLVDFQVVLETQRTQLATEDSLASAIATLSLDQVRIYKALGGGWTAPDKAPSESRLSPTAKP